MQTVWRKCGVGWQDVELLMILYQLQSVSALVVYVRRRGQALV